eukprot:702269-Hanusia_phi.AAC.2
MAPQQSRGGQEHEAGSEGGGAVRLDGERVCDCQQRADLGGSRRACCCLQRAQGGQHGCHVRGAGLPRLLLPAQGPAAADSRASATPEAAADTFQRTPDRTVMALLGGAGAVRDTSPSPDDLRARSLELEQLRPVPRRDDLCSDQHLAPVPPVACVQGRGAERSA